MMISTHEGFHNSSEMHYEDRVSTMGARRQHQGTSFDNPVPVKTSGTKYFSAGAKCIISEQGK